MHDYQNDGSSKITMTIALPQYTLEAYRSVGSSREADEYYLWNVPKTLAQTIMDDFKGTGKSVRPTYRGELVDIVCTAVTMDKNVGNWASYDSCLRVQGSIIYSNYSNEIEAPSSGQGYIYRVNNRFNSDGGYDATLDYIASVDFNCALTSQHTPFKATEEILYKNSRALIEAPTDNASGIYRANVRKNEDCTYDGELSYTYGKDAGEVSFESMHSMLLDGGAVIYKDRNTPVDAYEPYIQAGYGNYQGGIYTATNELTEEGLYNARMEYRGSTDDNFNFVSLNSPFKVTNNIEYENSRSIITAPSTTVGVYRVNQRENQDGTYTGGLEYQINNNTGLESFESLNSVLSEGDRIIYKSRDSAIDAHASAQGYMYRANNSLGDDGLYDSTLDYSGSISDNIQFTSMLSPFKSRQSISYSNSRVVIDAPATTSGMYQITQRENDDGTYTR